MARLIKTRIGELSPDKKNPRKPDEDRLALLGLSLQKLGFLLPLHATPEGLVLSGHQRLTVSQRLGYETVPVVFHELNEKQKNGINILFNRSTNDFGVFDTGSKSLQKLSLAELTDECENYDDFVDLYGEDWFAYETEEGSIKGLGKDIADKYNKRATVMVKQLMRLGIEIPIVVTESGRIVNGTYRLFAARETGKERWPLVQISDEIGDLALNFLNYLSMDYDVHEEFASLLRYSAYRRPQNNRGAVPKAMRFWANGERTRLDRDSYTKDYWSEFRDIHGKSLLDFGSGLSRAKPFLEKKGFQVTDFEPYRIDPDAESGEPSPMYSKRKVREFLQEVADGIPFDSVFLASVLNSIPFPQDRIAVLAIVHSLCGFHTGTFGTCRDISDFDYEYSGLRHPNHFVFDSEPGMRLGDSLARPKTQKFHSREETERLLGMLWKKVQTWSGGNVHYFRAKAPKRINAKVLSQALEMEFDLPYADGSKMGLVKEAKQAFGKRLGKLGVKL